MKLFNTLNQEDKYMNVYFIKENIKKLYASDFVVSALPENYVYDGEEHPQYIDIVYSPTNDVLTSSDLTSYGLSLNVVWNTDDFKNVTGEKIATVTLKQINNNFIFLDENDTEILYPWVYKTTRSFEITPNILQIEADDYIKIMGTADPGLTFQIKSGLVEGEVPGYTGSITRAPGEAPGTYSITQGDLQLADNPDGNFLANNYTIYFVPGVLLIQPAPSGGGEVTPPHP